MPTLFDDIPRESQEPAEYSESAFSYINRTGREHYAKARELFERWFTQYVEENPDEAANTRDRFRSEDNEVHFSALTELYTHNLLVANGFQTIAHPVLENSSKRPDFLVLKDGIPQFYTEVTVLYGDPLSTRIEKFESAILDVVNKVSSPDFLVSVDFKKSDSTTPPPISKIKKFLQERVSSLNYESVCQQIEETSDFPEFEWKHGDWELSFRVSPVSDEGRKQRNENSRIIGIIQHPVRTVNLDSAIKNALLAKAKKYGKLNLPFLVALNVIGDHIFCDDYSVMAALFGQETITFRMGVNGVESEPHYGRNYDGVFLNPKLGVTYTRLSAVLIIPGMSFANTETIKPTAWLHPRPEHAFQVGCIKNIRYKIHNAETQRMEDLEL